MRPICITALRTQCGEALRRLPRKLAVVLFLLVSLSRDSAHGASTLPEYDVKAAFLFNFIQFVEWPQRAFATPSAPLVIGIYGNDPFGASLDRIIKGEVIRGRKLLVKRIKHPEEAKSCQVLFICKSESSRVEEDLALVRGAGVLTVGDADRFVAQGGIIGFTMLENNVRFQINPENAQREQLIISSKLLRLAVAAP